MAGQVIRAGIDVTLVAGAANEVLQIKAGSDQRVLLRRIIITGKSNAGGADAATDVRLTLSSANFGTFTGTVVASKSKPETLRTAFAGNTTGGVRPTTPTDMGVYGTAPPQSGLVLPFNPPIEIAAGTAVNVELTNAGIVTHRVLAEVEE